MHPSSGNIALSLLTITTVSDSIGNKKEKVSNSHEVIGFCRSLTSSEYSNQTAVTKILDFKILIQSFLYSGEKYALVHNKIYKIERTYLNGQFYELYLSTSEYKPENLFDGYQIR